ncbi:MAG: sigma-70 family RNA polymerase sigma factor [Candidatus Gastranaerophilales bacterium]|nr:sigma-70 family RNA polymerase sigma factor [Candidatus Gastranaerophilales bacterium]
MTKANYKKIPQYLLIEMVQKDDFKALEELLRRIQKDIFAIFSHLCQKREIISDLTQETLVKIAKNIGKLKEISCFKTWANRIALNIFYDEMRKNSKIIEQTEIDNLENLNIEDTKIQPLEKCLASELGCIIKNCILSLPINSRIAIVLREFEGMSYDDIANLTHTNIGTVKSRISRARLKLQEELNDYI